MVGLGNAAYGATRKFAAMDRDDKLRETEEVHLQRALSMFGRAVQHNAGNAHAAMGIAIVMAERGYFEEVRVMTRAVPLALVGWRLAPTVAHRCTDCCVMLVQARHVFTTVAEAAAADKHLIRIACDALANLGHVHYGQGNYAGAATLYTQVRVA